MFKRNKNKFSENSPISMAFFSQPVKPLEPIRDILNLLTILITTQQSYWQPKRFKILEKETKNLKQDIIQKRNSIAILKLAYQYNCFWRESVMLPQRIYQSYEPQKISTLPGSLKRICMLLGIGGFGYAAYNSYAGYNKPNIFQIQQPTSSLFRRFSSLTPSIIVFGMALIASIVDRVQRSRQFLDKQEQQKFELMQKDKYYENKEKSYMEAYKKSWKYPGFFQSYSIEPPQPISQNQTSEIETQDSKNDLTTELIFDDCLGIFDTINFKK